MDSGGLLYFALYVSQQFGVMLGVGAQTVLLCAHLVAVHRGEQETLQNVFAKAARNAQLGGLVIMVLSGFGAVALHAAAGSLATVIAPVFLFKWLLIFAATVLFLVQLRFVGNVALGLAGGTWYALFLVHTLAPNIGWVGLLSLYGAWMVAFFAVWALFVSIMHWGRHHMPAPAKTVVQTPPAPVAGQPKPAPAPMPAVLQAVKAAPMPPAQPLAPKPAVASAPLNLPKLPTILEHTEPLLPKQIPGTRDLNPALNDLPGVHVMPQKPEDIGRHMRPAVTKSV